MPAAREACESHCEKLKERLDECNSRVTSREKTDENCHEEFIDFISCVDHCVRFSIRLFVLLLKRQSQCSDRRFYSDRWPKLSSHNAPTDGSRAPTDERSDVF